MKNIIYTHADYENDIKLIDDENPKESESIHLHVTSNKRIRKGNIVHFLGYTMGCIQKCIKIDKAKKVKGMKVEDIIHCNLNSGMRIQMIRIIKSTDESLGLPKIKQSLIDKYIKENKQIKQNG